MLIWRFESNPSDYSVNMRYIFEIVRLWLFLLISSLLTACLFMAVVLKLETTVPLGSAKQFQGYGKEVTEPFICSSLDFAWNFMFKDRES